MYLGTLAKVSMRQKRPLNHCGGWRQDSLFFVVFQDVAGEVENDRCVWSAGHTVHLKDRAHRHVAVHVAVAGEDLNNDKPVKGGTRETREPAKKRHAPGARKEWLFKRGKGRLLPRDASVRL